MLLFSGQCRSVVHSYSRKQLCAYNVYKLLIFDRQFSSQFSAVGPCSKYSSCRILHHGHSANDASVRPHIWNFLGAHRQSNAVDASSKRWLTSKKTDDKSYLQEGGQQSHSRIQGAGNIASEKTSKRESSRNNLKENKSDTVSLSEEYITNKQGHGSSVKLQVSQTDAAYVANLARPPALVSRSDAMRMTPDKDEIVEEGIDSLKDRVLPKWPLSKETYPTLQLHLIRTPRVSKHLSFRQLMQLLIKSKEPEVLLYQAEPHRLYFIVVYCLAFVFAVYGLIFLDWALRESWFIYINNLDDLPAVHNFAWFIIRTAVTLALFAVPAACSFGLIMLPTRLIRRLYYIPARNSVEAHVRFVVHPLIPRTASPVITLPISMIDRGRNVGKTKVWTGEGLYGTASRSQFMIFVFEKGRRIPWIADRQGWFWGDGRVWDVLFGKESIKEAEKGLSGDDILRLEMRQRKYQKEQEHKLLQGSKKRWYHKLMLWRK
ncbi:hypothetical protein V1511DRAFT_494654 [Dipodascopsis uninucleata]